MEYVWHVIAALGAGVGTGLAGLSAATVMTSVLIVLCPSFSGETGAYQATAIALASDILGSAVTALTYARKKHRPKARPDHADLYSRHVHGGQLHRLHCGKCGAVRIHALFDLLHWHPFSGQAGYQPGNNGGEGQDAGREGLGRHLFFGLTIGFGTGFMGTGGGMMMLIGFTAFLSMELKTAVGTSTFIMTFTALTASVSHILIHPAIVLEKRPVMPICMDVATSSRLISARFANRVKSRMVGLVTGAVLTVLGAAMLMLNYWAYLS